MVLVDEVDDVDDDVVVGLVVVVVVGAVVVVVGAVVVVVGGPVDTSNVMVLLGATLVPATVLRLRAGGNTS